MAQYRAVDTDLATRDDQQPADLTERPDDLAPIQTTKRDEALNRTDPEMAQRMQKRAMALHGIFLMRVKEMAPEDAWVEIHRPKRLRGKPENMRREMFRLVAWYQREYPPDFQQLLDMAGLGQQGIADGLRAMGRATRWCPHRKCEVPDWKVRTEAMRMVFIANGMFMKGSARGSAAEQTETKRTEQLSAIVTGEKFDSTEEWLEYIAKANAAEQQRIADEEERAAQEAQQQAQNGEAIPGDAEPFPDEDYR